MLSLPTNTSSYEAIVENNCYYVDKTSALKTVFQDDSSQVLLITRPPYFGKSLTM
ncbi:MAG: AAA family ATPase, partial [Succinivibrio sp.]|nr:AAA family ATPase [Succinivibrio sp.]